MIISKNPWSWPTQLQKAANFGFAILANVKVAAMLEIDKHAGICRE